MEFPLPDELIGSIVDHLDVPSLLRCMQVCKLFYSIISESTHSIYKIELFASHKEDNEYSSMETVNRLNLLREYNRKWNDLEWTSSGSIPMTDDNCWELSGGILAQVIHGNTLSLVQLPCKLKDIPEREWSVPFDFRIHDFTLDNSQDLIVLLELVETFPPNVSCKIHLRTLSGEQHPRAAETQITYTSTSLHDTVSFMIQICGNRVAVLFYEPLLFELDRWPTNPFFVWNWRTGQQEFCAHISGITSYAFMTEDLILATIIGSDSEPALQILRASAHVDPIRSLEEIPCVCELQLPKVQGEVEWFLIRSEPTPTWKPPTGSGVPFYASRKDCIFSVLIRAFVGDMERNTVLFLPLSTLLLEVERLHDVPRRNVPWDAWGPDGTRIFSVKLSETWICYTYGMKFVQHVPWNNGYAVQVYDFNPYAARKHVKTTVDSLLPWEHLAEESQPSGRCGSFDEQVITRLPGRVATIILEHSNDDWDAAMIGEIT
ncbi:hypothetical protein EV363DRAFT_1322086 [Boletus edulis]|nr:hypothetical protein EV363DRAFT_1322086 [Boletus edulis]